MGALLALNAEVEAEVSERASARDGAAARSMVTVVAPENQQGRAKAAKR